MALAAKKPNEAKTITATLIRGRVYVFNYQGKHHEFKRGVPVEVSKELAAELEKDTVIIETTDGDEIEKDRFNIDFDAEVRQVRPAPLRKRLRLVEAEEDEEDTSTRRSLARHTGPSGFKKPNRSR
jgi:hypothetical protein